MNENVREAVRLLGAYTAGRMDIWMLAGGPRASCRAHIMSALEGQRVPQSKAGITAIEQRFYSLAEVATNVCRARQQDEFIAWAQGQVSHA